jgi:hypothetical protein
MAKIGTVKMKIDMEGAEATVDVDYTITFDGEDQESGHTYKEEVRLIGDDTHANDPADLAGPDDVLGFLTPIFNNKTKFEGEAKVERHLTKTFRRSDLDEDRTFVPNPDELRARVTLTPVPPTAGQVVSRESAMAKRKIS